MIDNPPQMNDWEIKKFLRVVIVVQLVMLGLVGLGALGFGIPLLGQIVGFVYLSFIPGVIILRTLRLHELGSTKTLLYSVGLSLAFDMFLGFIINMLYPHIGISRPISTLPLTITWAIVLGLLCFVAYKRDKGFSIPCHFKLGELLSPPVLFLISLPLLAVVGTQLVNFYQANIVLMILICLIALVPILAIFVKFIPERLYPLAVYSIALALLWHFSLVSRYLITWDSPLEYHFFGLVAQSGVWNLEVGHMYNAMLSITILPATLSQLLDMSGTAIFKLIYPLWYALVPLGLYEVYRRHFSIRQAFLAVFFFVSIHIFFVDTANLNRMMIAELFCVLLIMLAIHREATSSTKALFVIFGAGLAVSHYSMSYIYMGLLILSLILLHLLREKRFHITTYSVPLFIVLCLAWYMYVSSSASLETVVYMGKHIYENLSIEFLNPLSRDVLYVFQTTSPDALHFAYRVLWYLMLFFMVVGATTLVSSLRQKRVGKEYATLAAGNYILLGVCIVIPFFSNLLGVTRMIHIASLLLAPFCILGAEIIFRSFSRAIQFVRHSTSRQTSSTVAVAVILVLFFLFESTLPFEIANSIGRSYSFAFGHVISGDNAIGPEEEVRFRSIPTEREVSSAEWLGRLRNEERCIHAPYREIGVPVLLSYGMIPPGQTLDLTPLSTMKDMGGSYIYLGYVNLVLGYGTRAMSVGDPVTIETAPYWDITRITPLLDNSMKVYTNGASEIYWSP